MAVLKLEKDDEQQEIEFELDYLVSLTTQQRFQMMAQKSREMLLLLGRDEHRKSTQVIKRTFGNKKSEVRGQKSDYPTI